MNKLMLKQILKEELLVMKLNQSVLREHKKLVSERKDAQSLILREILYSKYGRDFDIYQIDESLWGKVKNMVAKGGKKLANAFNVGKRGWEKEVDRQELEDLTTNAGKALPGGLIKQLTQPDPNGESFPNQEDKQDFASRLDAISFAYGAILAGLEAGTFPHESAEAAITALKKFLENSLGKMSTVYKTFNEEEEGDEELVAEQVLNEENLRGIWNKAKNSGDSKFISQTIDKLYDFIDKKGGLDSAGRAVADGRAGKRAEVAGAYLKDLYDLLPGPAKAAIENTPKPSIPDIPNLPDPETIRRGVVQTTGASGPAVKIVNTMKSVPSLKGFLATLGVSPAAAAAAAGVALVGGLYIKGKISSRAASIKRLLKTMEVPPATAQTNVVPEPGEPKPAPAGPSGDAGDAAAGGGEAAAGGGEAAAGGGEAAAGEEEKGGRDIYVFKGRGGKGIQSQLAKLGVKGKTMSGFLRALKKDLTAAGFNVLEEAKRETISLQNTLAMLDQMKGTDATTSNQKKAIKKILIQLLRSNKIRVDPESSKKLMDTEAPAGSGKASDPRKFFEHGRKNAQIFANNVKDFKEAAESGVGLIGFDESGEIIMMGGNNKENQLKPKFVSVKKATPEQVEYYKQFVAGIEDGLKTLNESKFFARWKLIAGVNKRVL